MGSERLPILSRSAEPTALQSQDGTISRSGLCEREHLPTDYADILRTGRCWGQETGGSTH
jgi:hypothetical protein